VKKFGVDILREGDEGEAVKLMQEYLDRLGYDLGSSGIDGDFGPKTEGALKAFQKEQKLKVDGEFGPNSHEAMMAAIDKLNETPIVPSASPDDLTVKPGEWRIRTGPGTAYSTAGFVNGGDKLTKIDLGNWVPVLFGGEVRFISKEAVEG
jgi:peptidoglycan hydrolase-like protein with peptidoglycan-binding domain